MLAKKYFRRQNREEKKREKIEILFESRGPSPATMITYFRRGD